ncbi:hypothetical protein [Methanobrevibacter sp.]
MNLITYYEKELNQKCYMIRGEEGYSNTTDTILTVTGDIDDSSVSYYTCPFRVEVLRDLDAADNSFVEIYDDDEVVLTIPWNSNVVNYDFELNLSYGIEHNIRAGYSGNRLCLRSYSNFIRLSEPVPDRMSCQVDLYQFNSSWNKNATGDITVRLRNSSGTVLSNKIVNLYIDEELIGGGTTANNGRVTFSNIDPSALDDEDIDERTYTVVAEFNGDDYYAPASYSTQLSVGYLIRVDEYDKALINTEVLTVKATMFNQRGYVPSAIYDVNTGAKLYIEAYNGSSWVRVCGNTTLNSEGKTTMTVSRSNVNNNIIDGVLMWRVKGEYPTTATSYVSDEYTTRVAIPENIVFETTRPIIGHGQIATLSGSVSGVGESIRVSLTGDVNKTLYTSNNGRFETIYEGLGDGNKSITATCGAVSQTITFKDVIQYWDAVLGSINKNYTIISPYVLELSNGFKFSPQSTGGYSELGLGNGTPLTYAEWMLSFKVVNSTNHFDFIVGSWKLNEQNNRVTETYNIQNLTLNQGQIITIVCANDKLSVLLDGDEIASDIDYLDGGSPIIGIKDESKNHYLTINNLEFIRE